MVSPNPTRIQIRIRQIEFTALDVLLSIHNCCIIVGTLQYILCLIYQLANAKFPRSCQLWLHISVRCPQLRTSWVTFPFRGGYAATFDILHASGGVMLIIFVLLGYCVITYCGDSARTHVTLALMSSANVLTLLRNSPTATAARLPPSSSAAAAIATSHQH